MSAPSLAHALALIGERRIAEAIANGDLDNLPGAGRPLALDDDRLVPEDCRAAYRILKNAGCAPREVLARREQALLERMPGDRAKIAVKLALLRAALEK
jgi:hypothetical protein